MELPKLAVDRVVGVFADAELGDPRRTRRVLQLVGDLARAPSASLPAALGSDSKVQGAYRLINNPRVSFETFVGVQAEIARQRAEEARNVFVLHDTTDCGFPHLDPDEIGYLQTGKPGFLAHLSLVVDAESWRRPLGVVAAETIHRSQRSKRSRKLRTPGSETRKWEDREFERWWRGMEAAGKTLEGCASVIHVADREGDSYELMHQLLASKQKFIIRVRTNRRGRKADAVSDDWTTVKQIAAGTNGLVEREVSLSRRKAKGAPGMNKSNPPRKMRMATLSFAATQVEVRRPRYLREPVSATLALNLVRVVELQPPPGEPGVEWLLYTTEAVDTVEQVEAVVDGYRTRWVIEELNSALKTGCAYEARQFETRHALLTMLALSMPVACEVLWLRSRARSTPDVPATQVVTPLQLRVLRTLGSVKLPPRPTAQQALRAVAALGGHLKRNGPPGWKVLMRGMTKLLTYEEGWVAGQAAPRGVRNL